MKTTLLWAVVIAVAVAILAGWAIGSRQPGPVDYAQADVLRAQDARRAEWQAAALPIRLALYALGGGVVVAGAGGLLWAWVRVVDRRARTFYPDANGIMAAVLLRRGETVADLGALAGPLSLQGGRPAYHALPPGAVAELQATANQGAGLTRATRAWATHEPGKREPAALPWPTAPQGGQYPPIEVLAGDESHIMRLLEGGDGE